MSPKPPPECMLKIPVPHAHAQPISLFTKPTPRLPTRNPLVDDVDVAVRLGDTAAILPADVALVGDAAVGSAAALEGVVGSVRRVGPRVEQRDVAAVAARAGAEGADKVTGLEVRPRDGLGNLGQRDCAVARGGGVQRHRDEARAVGAVVAALGVRVGLGLRVGNVLGDPLQQFGSVLFSLYSGVLSRKLTLTFWPREMISERLIEPW